MKFNLTVVQRPLGVSGAASVALLLLIYAERVGLDHTPWMGGVLIIISLLFLAIWPTSHKEAQSTTFASIQPANAVTVAYEVIEVAFTRVFEETTILDENDSINLTTDIVRLQSAKLAWMVTMMALEQAYPGFRTGHRFESMGLIAFMEFKKHLHSGLRFYGPEASAELIELAAREVAACTDAFDHTSARLISKEPHPLNPIFAEIERSYKFADVTKSHFTDNNARLDAAYGPVFRSAYEACRAALD